MVQDFAKIRAAAAQEKTPPPASSGWAPLLTGLIAGLALGIFLSFMAYLSGVVPPLDTTAASQLAAAQETEAAEESQQRLSEDLERAAARLQLEFYRELPNYEVIVDTSSEAPPPAARTTTTTAATVTETQPQAPSQTNGVSYMIQAGAYQQENSANLQSQRLQTLGLNARVRKEALLGKTLFLVQAGPYQTRDELNQAERLLRNNNIDSMRITLGGM